MDISLPAIQLTTEDSDTLHSLHGLLSIFVKPTVKLQAEPYPTFSTAAPHYLRTMLKLKLKRREAGPETTIGLACTAALRKLMEFHCMATTQILSHSNVATVLDPRFNVHIYDILMPNSSQQERRCRAKEHLKTAWSKYAARQRAIDNAAVQDESKNETGPVWKPNSDDEIFGSNNRAFEAECTR